MPKLNRTKLETFIRQTKGKFFHVAFRKKDGTLREMTCQIPKPKKNAKRASNANQSNAYVLVTDVKLYCLAKKDNLDHQIAMDKSYRLINLETVIEVRSNGEVWRITE